MKMKFCNDCKYFNRYLKVCTRESDLNNRVKIVSEYCLACKHYKEENL